MPQGDGSHLVGEFTALGAGPLTQLDATDSGSDADFDDNDSNQRLYGALKELLSIFPQLAPEDYQPKPACFIPPGKQQKKLIARHVRNKKPLLSSISFNASQSGWPA